MSIVPTDPRALLPCMPDGTPAPYLLTQDEAIRFLRLDECGVRFPAESFRNLRNKYHLQAVQVGKGVRFPLPELLNVLERMQQENPR